MKTGLLARLKGLARRDDGRAALAAPPPDEPALRDRSAILRAARRLKALDAEAAAQAWQALLALDAHHVEARNHLAEAELYDLGRAVSGKSRFRLAVIGNCQAYAVAACLRRLAPEAEVRAMSVGELDPGEDTAPIADRLSAFDAVVGQPLGSKYGALASAALIRSTRRLEPFPRIHFTGFHPDLLPAGVYPRGMHSKLVLAGWAMGLPKARVEELFNAYVYGVLGYFDEYAKSEAHHLEQAGKIGFELEPLMDSWRGAGPFVHVHVHPTLRVCWAIAERLASSLGLSANSKDPDIDDPLEPLGVWPVYPEIARRVGVAGSLTFKFRDLPPMDLDAMIDREFAACAGLDRGRVRESVAEVIAVLRGEGI